MNRIDGSFGPVDPDVPRERGDEPSLGMGRKIWGVMFPASAGMNRQCII